SPETCRNSGRPDARHDTCSHRATDPATYQPGRIAAVCARQSSDADSSVAATLDSARQRHILLEYPSDAEATSDHCRSRNAAPELPHEPSPASAPPTNRHTERYRHRQVLHPAHTTAPVLIAIPHARCLE